MHHRKPTNTNLLNRKRYNSRTKPAHFNHERSHRHHTPNRAQSYHPKCSQTQCPIRLKKQDNPYNPLHKNKLKNRMEFLLSNENLYHDKFFADILEKQGCIPLSLLLKCNSIKSHLEGFDNDDDKKTALKVSLKESLTLLLDEENDAVTRKETYKKERVVQKMLEKWDIRTLIVEKLPYWITVDNIKTIFSGKISYVKIFKIKNGVPKFYRKAKVIFNSTDARDEALKLHGTIPEDLRKIYAEKANKYNGVKADKIKALKVRKLSDYHKDLSYFKELRDKHLEELTAYCKEQNKAIEIGKVMQRYMEPNEARFVFSSIVKMEGLKKDCDLDLFIEAVKKSELPIPEYIDNTSKDKHALLRFFNQEDALNFHYGIDYCSKNFKGFESENCVIKTSIIEDDVEKAKIINEIKRKISEKKGNRKQNLKDLKTKIKNVRESRMRYKVYKEKQNRLKFHMKRNYKRYGRFSKERKMLGRKRFDKSTNLKSWNSRDDCSRSFENVRPFDVKEDKSVTTWVNHKKDVREKTGWGIKIDKEPGEC